MGNDVRDGLSEASSSRGRLLTRLVDTRDWVLLEFDRYLFAVLLSLVGFGLFFWLEVAGIIDVKRTGTPLLYLFSALVGGNVTLITIVVTINQLILSRELRSPRELQLELSSAEEYREEIEEQTAPSVVPEEPSDFLRVLLDNTREQVARLDSASFGSDAPELAGDLDEMVANLTAELDAADRLLDRSTGSLFGTLLAILDADFVSSLNYSRSIRRSHEVSGATEDGLEEFEHSVEQLDIARQYFKTIYIKQELAGVSKLVIYTGFFATVVALGALMATGYGSVPSAWWAGLLLVPVSVAINLLPIALLTTHVLRIATVARRTAAITPFIAPNS